MAEVVESICPVSLTANLRSPCENRFFHAGNEIVSAVDGGLLFIAITLPISRAVNPWDPSLSVAGMTSGFRRSTTALRRVSER